MQHSYDYDLALHKMSKLIRDARLERVAASAPSAPPSGPGPRARLRAAVAGFRTPGSGATVAVRDCLETGALPHGRPA